jgi:hypothetical protein
MSNYNISFPSEEDFIHFEVEIVGKVCKSI